VREPPLSRFRNGLCAALYMIIVIPFLLLLSPARWLHPLLRAAGVPTRLLPTDWFQIRFSRGVLAWAGVAVDWAGVELLEADRSYIVMYSHQSSYDAFAITASPLPVRLIGKTSLFFIPLLGWLAAAWGHIAIDRANLSKAIQALDTALHQLKSNGRSLCIAPEGTRSPVGRLIDFKKGPFHTAMQARIPVAPVLLIGASDLWPARAACGARGRIAARVLPPIAVRDDDNYRSLRARVHRACLRAYAEPVPADAKYVCLVWSVSALICDRGVHVIEIGLKRFCLTNILFTKKLYFPLYFCPLLRLFRPITNSVVDAVLFPALAVITYTLIYAYVF